MTEEMRYHVILNHPTIGMQSLDFAMIWYDEANNSLRFEDAGQTFELDEASSLSFLREIDEWPFEVVIELTFLGTRSMYIRQGDCLTYLMDPDTYNNVRAAWNHAWNKRITFSDFDRLIP